MTAKRDTGATAVESVASWNQQWRDTVTRQMEDSAQAHQKTAIIQERVLGRLDEHDRRITALEAQPTAERANSISDRTQIMMFCSLILALLALIVSILHGGPITIP